jgi:hypothetical protein
VNNPNTGTINGVKINQLLGVNDRNIAVGFYVDTAGATHGYTYGIETNTFSANIDDPNGVGATPCPRACASKPRTMDSSAICFACGLRDLSMRPPSVPNEMRSVQEQVHSQFTNEGFPCTRRS